MNDLIQKLVGMGGMTDQVIATDFLISTKAAIKDYSVAISETTSPSVRAVLREQLRDAVETHAKLTDFMIGKGYYEPNDIRQQLSVDFQAADTAVNLAQK
ncbi:spore coat protein [Niallia sp. Krafla_26]|uniref:spore coat protein n=1 Tax=Niallia sp. Krafla_26 TaxID=3064703 RepID=UPI003D16DBEB